MSANSKQLAPTNLKDWTAKSSALLTRARISSARLDAELLLAFVLKKDRTWLIAHPDAMITTQNLKKLERLVLKRCLRVPLAYLTGKKEFYGRSFIVTPDVLIPRPETEVLIDLAKKYTLQGRILDVGCGSGCIGLTIALEVPETKLTLSDISLEALIIARKNASQHNVTPVRYVQSDLLGHWLSRDSPKKFSSIVANLPYVDHGWERSPETEHEPSLALFAEMNGLELIFKLIGQAKLLIIQGGYLLLEADPEQHDEVIICAQQNEFSLVERNDYIVVLQKS